MTFARESALSTVAFFPRKIRATFPPRRSPWLSAASYQYAHCSGEFVPQLDARLSWAGGGENSGIPGNPEFLVYPDRDDLALGIHPIVGHKAPGVKPVKEGRRPLSAGKRAASFTGVTEGRLLRSRVVAERNPTSKPFYDALADDLTLERTSRLDRFAERLAGLLTVVSCCFLLAVSLRVTLHLLDS